MILFSYKFILKNLQCYICFYNRLKINRNVIAALCIMHFLSQSNCKHEYSVT